MRSIRLRIPEDSGRPDLTDRHRTFGPSESEVFGTPVIIRGSWASLRLPSASQGPRAPRVR
eukprot:11582388-Karenia_brevis.AAC.1